MRKLFIYLFIYLFFLIPLTHAASLPPLVVATEVFNPPFVMRGADKQLYGFDIEMMNSLCQIMHRQCEYHSDNSENSIIEVIANNKADLGLATITITLERSKKALFTLPYLPSYNQFLGLKKIDSIPFSQTIFNGKNIGIQEGTIYRDTINDLGFSNVKIIQYKSTSQLIEALQNESVDFILLDAGAAQYWASQMPIFTTVGKPFIYGYGLGIVINKNQPQLQKQVNDALLEYQKNGDFQKNYDRYLLKIN